MAGPARGAGRDLFEPGLDGLFWSLVEILEDEGRLAEMSRAARERLSREFDSAAVGPDMERFLMAGPDCTPVTVTEKPDKEPAP